LVKKGRFSEDLSAFRGRTLGILGAHNTSQRYLKFSDHSN
jgi:hypothetical protein